MVRLMFLLAALIILAGCIQVDYEEGDDGTGLTVGTTWYWQLYIDETHPLRRDIPARLYDIDLFDVPESTIRELKAEGKIVICYFSAGSYENWRPDADRFPPEALGNPLDNWEGERWLDIRNTTVRQIMVDRLELARQKGCDGVEPDNVDGYVNNTGFDLTYNDQLEYNLFLAHEAHSRGLLIGLKNDLLQIKDLVDYFDFAVNEQCHQYNECDYLEPFIKQGKPVFNAEYDSIYVDNPVAFDSLCEDARNRNFRTVVYPLNLDGSFVKSCDYGIY
ncbi:endo alpha-1,4 polygalactosaminidase [Persephonella sp.]